MKQAYRSASTLALTAALAFAGLGGCAQTAASPDTGHGVAPPPSQTPAAAAPKLDMPPPEARANPAVWPKVDSPDALTDAATEAFITELMSRMTVEEKVGQTIQADIASITPEEMKTYPLGSILAGGNSAPGGNDRAPAQAWLDLARAFRAANAERPGTKIPLMFGIDAVHGHNNVVGATIFPHNIGLGAARDPDLIRRIGKATAEEVAVAGAEWTFGPTVAVPQDDRWGRAYEGYSEDPEVVAAYAGPMTLGLQGELKAGQPLEGAHIAGSAKHFLADGGTTGGKDQGDARISEAELVRIHNAGYPPAISAGVLTVMASFSSWNGVKHTGNPTLLNDVMKNRMGFDGFIVGDWNAHGQVAGCTNESCPQAFNAGLDMFMAPDSWRGLYTNTLAQVRSGEISMARLDEAVRRILRVKAKLGLFTQNPRPLEGRLERLGAPEHQALAREAVRKSLVLIKNNGGVLPIRPNRRILVAGDGADDIGKASGGWTLTWQGTGNKNADFPNGQSIYGGIAEAAKAAGGSAELSVDGSFRRKPDVAVVVFGENPYAEFQGDIDTLDFEPGDAKSLALLKKLKAQGIPVVSVFLSGRPMWTNPEINASDAFVAAWLPGSAGGGVADVLLAKADGTPNHDFTGKLSFSWPKTAEGTPLNVGQPGYDPQFAFGYGLTYRDRTTVPQLSEVSGVAAAAVSIDRYFAAGRAVAPWTLYVRDAEGIRMVGDSQTASPRGTVAVRTVDATAQEGGKAVVWTGAGGDFGVGAMSPVDLQRQSNGEMAVSVRYRVDRAPTAPVTAVLASGQSAGALDVTSLFQQAPVGQWRTVKIRLSCFAQAGANVAQVNSPLTLRTAGEFGLSVEEIRLASNEGDAICPAAAR
jgi:beta-glucosidase